MKSRTLTMMAIATACVIIAAFLLSRQSEMELSSSGEPVLPGLLSQVNEVEEITVTTKARQVGIVRKGEEWGVKEKARYRADMGKVRETLIGLAELKILEPKTRDPERYEKLGLQDIEAEDSTSMRVRLNKAAGETVAEIILGNRRPAKGNPSRDEIYVRKPEDPQTWLASGHLDVERFPVDWLEKEIVSIDENRIHRVQVTHKDGHSYVIQKENPEDKDFTIVDLPSKKKIRTQFAVNNIATTLATLSLDDVKPKAATAFPENADTTALLETFDGLTVTVRIAEIETKPHVTIQAAFDSARRQAMEPAKDPSPKKEEKDEKADDEESGKSEASEVAKEVQEKQEEKEPQMTPIEEVQQEGESLSTQHLDWVYILPQFRADTLTKRLEDLLEPEK